MAEKECEKIIDQVTDPRNLNDQCRQHIKVCSECAAVIACMVWTRAKGSPTADLKPSQAFLDRIDQSINSLPDAGTPGISGGGSNLLTWVLGVAIAATVTFGVVTSLNRESTSAPAVSTGKTLPAAAEATNTAAEAESRVLDAQPAAPTLKFPSPADDVD